MLSVGVGVPYSDGKRRFRKGHADLGGHCLKVLVARKKREDQIPPDERIPRWIEVELPGRERPMRVPIDVVAIGKAKITSPKIQQAANEGRPWPQAGAVKPGRTFSFLRNGADGAKGTHVQTVGIEIGTCGSLFTMPANGSTLYGTSAGHVFTRPCCGIFEPPVLQKGSALGVSGPDWVRVLSDAFFPDTIQTDGVIQDALTFKLPPVVYPGDAGRDELWPALFEGEIATPADRSAAKALSAQNVTNGFVAVQRQKADGTVLRQKRNFRFEMGQLFTPEVDCGAATGSCPYYSPPAVWNYGWTWSYRFTSGVTIGGDSGSPVFLQPEGVTGSRVVLLGFHFLLLGVRGFCIDANSFLGDRVGIQGKDWDFYKAKPA